LLIKKAGCSVFSEILEPGIPIEQTGAGDHPPRSFNPATPGSEPRPAWAILSALLDEQLSLHQIRTRLEDHDSRFNGLSLLQPGDEGQRISGVGSAPPPVCNSFPQEPPHGSLPLLVTESLFGSELLAAHTEILEAVAPRPLLYCHPQTATEHDLAEGEQVQITCEAETLSLQLRCEPHMAEGLLLAYRLRGTPLELFLPGSLTPVLLQTGGDND